jgi:putative spermidine/putrescine transport system permease protein
MMKTIPEHVRNSWRRRLLAGLLASPLLWLALLSAGRQWPYPALLPLEWTPEHWSRLLTGRSDLAFSLFFSLGLSGGVAVLITALSFGVSRAVAYHRRRRYWLLAAYLPYVFSPVILAACLQYFFLRANLAGAVAGVFVAQVLITMPYGVIFFTNFWNGHIRSLEQLAYTLGSSRWQATLYVLWPAARGTLLTGFFQIFLISWFEYGLTQLIGLGKAPTLTIKVFQYVQEANLFYAALAGTLLALPPVVLLWINKRFVFSRML